MTKKLVDVAVYHKEKSGQAECGDSFFYIEKENVFVCALADGLGSGKLAKESSETVIDLIKENVDAEEEEILIKCNERLRNKRGVVIGILKIDFTSLSYTYSSIGNIGLMIITNDNKKFRNIPKHGYLANYYRKLKVIRGAIEKNTNFLIYSDGVTESELSRCYFLNGDVHELIDQFNKVNRHVKRIDDTTLIAIRYKGE